MRAGAAAMTVAVPLRCVPAQELLSDVDAVLLLEAALRHDEAGHVWPIGGDLAARLRTALSSSGGWNDRRCQGESECKPHHGTPPKGRQKVAREISIG
jgi:hypothetical protein